MPSLREVQTAVQRSMLTGNDDSAREFLIGAGVEPDELLAVHRNTILGALANALRLSFPVVHALVDADFFAEAAQTFARERPPQCADLNAYGAEFPDFLQHFEPAATLAYLPDVARLEWAVNRALRAPDAQALDTARLADIASIDQGRVCFVAHPSISMLRSHFAVDTIWGAVLDQDEAAMRTLDLAGGAVFLMVQRMSDQVTVTRLDESAWNFSRVLPGGQPLGAALDAVPGFDAAGTLADHLMSGRLVGFHSAEQEPSP
jgi:hypothetical protein